MRRREFVRLAPAVGLLAACGGSDPVIPGGGGGGTGGGGGGGAVPDVTVRIVDNAFVDPQSRQNAEASVTIDVGQTIEWDNQGSVTHTVSSTEVPAGAQSFSSGNVTPGNTFQRTFNTAGTYRYRCQIHPVVMRDATIIVQ